MRITKLNMALASWHPRGWHCLAAYGSVGGSLYVTPDAVNSHALFSNTWGGFKGPAIQASESIGGTSGRFEVARVIARIFPAYNSFVQQVIDEKIRPASDFPFGPYPQDELIYHSKRIVEYQTPPHSEGLGTMSWLRANDFPIRGVEILVGEDPDLISLAVRLPPGMGDLTSPIVRQIESDNPVGK